MNYEWSTPLTEEIIKRELLVTQEYNNNGYPLYAIFVNGKPVYLTKVRVYKSKGRALSELRSKFSRRKGSDGKTISKQELDKLIQNLIKEKIIEIKEL